MSERWDKVEHKEKDEPVMEFFALGVAIFGVILAFIISVMFFGYLFYGLFKLISFVLYG